MSCIHGVYRLHQLCASCLCNGFSPSPPMSSISAADRSSMHVQRLSPSPPFACARAVCLLIITAANFSSSRHLSSLPRSLFWLKPGAARMEAARSSQNQPEAPRSTQRHPEAPRSTQEQPEAPRSTKTRHTHRRRHRLSSLGVSAFCVGMRAWFCDHQSRPANASNDARNPRRRGCVGASALAPVGAGLRRPRCCHRGRPGSLCCQRLALVLRGALVLACASLDVLALQFLRVQLAFTTI